MMIHSIKIFELFPSLDFGYTVTSSLFTMYICSSVTKEWHHKPATESKYNECKLVHIANGWVYMNEESLACTLQQLHVFFTIFFCRKNPKDSNIFQ